MRDQIIGWITGIMLTFLLPYCFTMLLTGMKAETGEGKESGIKIILEDGRAIDLEEYVKEVTAGEISMEEEQEAINAQMVIVRTNLIRKIGQKKEIEAKSLNVRAVDEKTLRENLGVKKYSEATKKLRQAQKKTSGIVLKYKKKYIEALYHVCNTGMTVSAKEITGKEKAYLQSEESSQDIESENYMNVEEFSKAQVVSKLKTKLEAKKIDENNVLESIHIEKKTELGYVKQIKVGEEEMTGEEWRTLFSLSSDNFYIEEYEGKIRMISLGKGHGMGLSQYGANEMAKQGRNYKEILKHYYRNIILESLK
ncbi:MAG: SpoIID/LytB domain-containing protein [Lachnospiraceae bacterium]